MSKREYIGAWLTDGYARLFLGVTPATDMSSRWVAIGERHDNEPVGFWIDLKHVEELRANGKRVIYRCKPTMCLLRWDGIITIQRLKKGTTPEIGIQP